MNKEFKKVLFAGYYGMQNVGDDSFGVISAWGAEKYWKAQSVLLLSRRNLHGAIKTNNCLSETSKFKGQTLLESYKNLSSSSLNIWAGGSTFHSKQKWYSAKNFSAILSGLRLIPAGAIGISLGPYKSSTDQKYIYKTLKSFRFLALRDNSSYEEAISIGLPYKPVLASDLAMLLPKIEVVADDKRENNVLGISICHYERYCNLSIDKERIREKKVLQTLKKLFYNDFNGKFRFFVFNGNTNFGDKSITDQFAYELKAIGASVEVLDYVSDPIYVWKKVAECSAFLSIRLHGAIYAAAANVPCIAVEYHKKCSEFLTDIGVQQKWRIGDAECDYSEISDKLGNILNLDSSPFYLYRKEIIDRAEKNFTCVPEMVCK